MNEPDTFEIHAIGRIESPLTHRRDAPRQGSEGAPDAWVVVTHAPRDCLDGLEVGQEIILVTWLHEANREVHKERPRGNPDAPLTGVFATRSPDRPNPIGLHRVTILALHGDRLHVAPLEAIDGTPVIDIKPIICPGGDA